MKQKLTTVSCHKCNALFKVGGFYVFLLVSGGIDCPNCNEKYGIDVIHIKNPNKRKNKK